MNYKDLSMRLRRKYILILKYAWQQNAGDKISGSSMNGDPLSSIKFNH